MQQPTPNATQPSKPVDDQPPAPPAAPHAAQPPASLLHEVTPDPVSQVHAPDSGQAPAPAPQVGLQASSDVTQTAAPVQPPPALTTSVVTPVVVSSRLAHLAAVAKAVVQTSARAGITNARIELRPPELGHVEIRLRYGGDGVSATLTASSSAAAHALSSTAGDLRRALEAQGLTVLGLDVGHAGADERRRPEGDGGQAQAGSAATGDAEDQDEDGSSTTNSTIRVPAAGSSVDVLA